MLNKSKIAIVIPTIRMERINHWLTHWKEEFTDSQIIIVEDNPQKTFQIKQDNILHYCWEEIDRELKDISWIIPRRTSAIRSYGFYQASKLGADVVITLDDDCYLYDKNFIDTHLYYLNQKYSNSWTQHAQSHLKMRGYPNKLETRNSVINMGLWANIPDLDGRTQKLNPTVRMESAKFNFPLAKGVYAPISSMNLAFRTKIVPAFYFLLMGPSWGFDRFDDIWAGIIIKKICDHLGNFVTGGEPFVWHDRASNPDVNIQKEATGLKVNEYFWKSIDNIILKGKDYKSCYIEIAKQITPNDDHSHYWEKLRSAMQIWANLF